MQVHGSNVLNSVEHFEDKIDKLEKRINLMQSEIDMLKSTVKLGCMNDIRDLCPVVLEQAVLIDSKIKHIMRVNNE